MSASAELQKQVQILSEGSIDLIDSKEFQSRLAKSIESKKPLRIKYGADPSSPDLHLGHTVPLRKLRQFQDCGHLIVFIIGDFTARIGDPSHRNETRPMLSEKQIKENAETYQKQVFKILDEKKTEVCYNSEWLDKMSPADFLHLTSQYTVARLLERDDFQKRFKSNQPIALIEFLYPLLQGYDSVMVKSDLELGGTDQKFNLLVGRELQKVWEQAPQMVMTLPLLEGTDGIRKMSKSFDNSISIQDVPKEMFGKTMSLPDALIPVYAQYACNLTSDERNAFLQKFKKDPRNGKADLAEIITTLYWGKEEAGKAHEEFDRIFKKKGLPDEIKTTTLNVSQMDIVSLLKETELVPSKGEARRLVEQGGVKINQQKVASISEVIELDPAVMIQCGKRKFLKVQGKKG